MAELSIPPPARVAIGTGVVGGQRVELFLNPEWARYFESLNRQTNTLSGAVGLPGAPGTTGAAGVGVSLSDGDSGSTEFFPMPGPQGPAGIPGAVVALMQDSESSDAMLVPGPAGSPGAKGDAGPALWMLSDAPEGTDMQILGPQGLAGVQGSAGPPMFLLSNEADPVDQILATPNVGQVVLVDSLGSGVAAGLAMAAVGSGGPALATSGSFTATATGLTTSPTCTVNYTKVGDIVVLSIIAGVSGTSNTGTFTLTGVPAAITPAATKNSLGNAQDNGGAKAVGLCQLTSSGAIAFYKDANGSSFTASGTKSISGQVLVFHMT